MMMTWKKANAQAMMNPHQLQSQLLKKSKKKREGVKKTEKINEEQEVGHVIVIKEAKGIEKEKRWSSSSVKKKKRNVTF